MSIQEEIDNKTIALVISTTKLTGRLLQAAIREYQRQRQNHKNNKQVIDNNTLTALTLLIAESNPKEKDVIIDLVMNFLNND